MWDYKNFISWQNEFTYLLFNSNFWGIILLFVLYSIFVCTYKLQGADLQTTSVSMTINCVEAVNHPVVPRPSSGLYVSCCIAFSTNEWEWKKKREKERNLTKLWVFSLCVKREHIVRKWRHSNSWLNRVSLLTHLSK